MKNNLEYKEYLLSENWKDKVKKLKEFRDHKCQECGETKNLHAHHLHYNTVYNENIEIDLKLLCESCHSKEHGFEIKTTKKIKGGFVMVYKSYEEAIEQVISSKKDYAIVVSIKNQFTYDQVEVSISHEEMAKDFEVSRQKITTIIKSMVDNKILMRVRKGVYRLNPFMYLPYRSEGVKLQSYWKNLIEQEKQNS